MGDRAGPGGHMHRHGNVVETGRLRWCRAVTAAVSAPTAALTVHGRKASTTTSGRLAANSAGKQDTAGCARHPRRRSVWRPTPLGPVSVARGAGAADRRRPALPAVRVYVLVKQGLQQGLSPLSPFAAQQHVQIGRTGPLVARSGRASQPSSGHRVNSQRPHHARGPCARHAGWSALPRPGHCWVAPPPLSCLGRSRHSDVHDDARV